MFYETELGLINEHVFRTLTLVFVESNCTHKSYHTAVLAVWRCV